MATSEINHEMERMLTDTTGHEHGCWEVYAEIAVETLCKALGVPLDQAPIAGRHDDVIGGRTIWDAYTEDVLINRTVCHCDDPADEE